MKSIIEIKTFDFAVRIVNLYKYLTAEKQEYVLSKQLLKCGTSIGANVSEAERGQSKADFNSKLNIALKEANETYYWLRLLHQTNYLSDKEFNSLETDINEIIAILVSICKKKIRSKCRTGIINSAFCTLHFALILPTTHCSISVQSAIPQLH